MSSAAADLRYPIGPFSAAAPSADVRRRAVADITAMPGHLAKAVAGLNDKQLDTPYRLEGWSVRQVVHHHFAERRKRYDESKNAEREVIHGQLNITNIVRIQQWSSSALIYDPSRTGFRCDLKSANKRKMIYRLRFLAQTIPIRANHNCESYYRP